LDGCEEVGRVAAVFLDEMAVDPRADIDEREDINSRVEVEILPGQHCNVEGVVREGLVATLLVDE
jgi:translation initiation factor 6 (eIF-6)